MSEKIYRWLLTLYPARFRDEDGEAMRQVFRDRLRAEPSGFGRLRLWFDVLWDLAVSVPRERRRGRTVNSPAGAYSLSEEAVRKMVGRTHIAPLGSFVLSLVLGVAVGLIADAPRWPLLGVYSLFALIVLMSLRDIPRTRRHWRGYELILEGNRILLKQDGAVTKTLMRPDVTRLVETAGVGLAIGTSDPRKGIWAPSVLTGYEELRERLSAWVAIEPTPHRSHQIRPRTCHAHCGTAWLWSFYASALLVRSVYWVVPMASIAAAALLLIARPVFRNNEAPLVSKAVPVVMVALLALKLAWTLR